MNRIRVKQITVTDCPAGTPNGCLGCPFFCGITYDELADTLRVSCGYRPDKK